MALEKRYSEEILNELLNNFKIAKTSYTFQPLTNGLINDTFLVCKEATPHFILQRINHQVFENIEGLMRNIDVALKQLKAKDYAKIKLVPAESGKTYVSHSSGYWRVMTFITESTTYNTSTDSNIAFEAGRIVGKFHALLDKIELRHFVDTIPKFHDLELRKMQFLAALARASKDKTKTAYDSISFAQDTLAKIEAIENKHLPVRVCHNDTKLNNILFSKTTREALCLIDLDTIMKGHFHYDFGDAIRTVVNTAPEDELDHSKITFDKNQFEAFVNGLAHNGPFLSKEEVQALPYGVILMPFLHGIRALTDFLNNNIYYKVTHESQNLDRCQSLFDFAKKALNELDFMEDLLNTKLPSV